MPKAFCELETCAKRLSELCALCKRKNLYEVCKQPNRGNLTYHAPPCGGGVGGGATSSWARNCAQKVLLNLCALWEKKLPSESQAFFLTWRVRSLSHRRTQMNRTHKGQKDSGPSLYPNRSPLRVLLFKPTRHCFVVPSLSLQQVFSVVKNHYISPN